MRCFGCNTPRLQPASALCFSGFPPLRHTTLVNGLCFQLHFPTFILVSLAECKPALKIGTPSSPFSFLSFYSSVPGLPPLRLELARARSLAVQAPPLLARARSAALTSPGARCARPFHRIHTISNNRERA